MQNILIKNPNQCVIHSIESLPLLSPCLTQLFVNSQPLPVIFRSDWSPSVQNSQIALITGGGAGHEPAHTQYVGKGMLTAAISGQIFASPSVQIIFDTIEALVDKQGPGCLLIVKNYTGDRLNFGLAVEKAKTLGIKIRMLIVEDDCSLEKEKGVTGRRGIAGTILIHKVAGALTETKLSLEELYLKLSEVLNRVKTIGVAFSSCNIPGREKENRIKEGFVELGLGIHNEPGVETIEYKNLEHLVGRMIEKLLGEYPKTEGNFVIMINNLGTCTSMEMGLIVREVFLYFNKNLQKEPLRIYSGSYMTSFDMKGFSITLFEIDQTHNNEYISYLDHPVNVLGWNNLYYNGSNYYKNVFNFTKETSKTIKKVTDVPINKRLIFILEKVAKKLLDNEKNLNELDSYVGDGDCGSTLALGAAKLLQDLPNYPLTNVCDALDFLTKTIEDSMGGTSGVIYRIFFTSLTHNYSTNTQEKPLSQWKKSLNAAISSLLIYDNAREGDRTLLDALIPAIKGLEDIFEKAQEDEVACANVMWQCAQNGAEKTKYMKAAAGRSNYVPEEILSKYEDPGAKAIGYIFEGIYEGLVVLNKK